MSEEVQSSLPVVPPDPFAYRAFQKWNCVQCDREFKRLVSRGMRRQYCDECNTPVQAALRRSKVKKSNQIRRMERADEEIPKIIEAMMDNPGISNAELTRYLGIPTGRIMRYFTNNLALAEMRRHASRKINAMIPKAIKAIDEIVQDQQHSDRFKAAVKVLDSERVLGPERVDVNVNVEKKSVEELRQVLEEALKIPQPTILETELISDDTNPAQ